MQKLSIETKLTDGHGMVTRQVTTPYFAPQSLEEAVELDGKNLVLQEYLKGRIVTFRNGEVKPLMKLNGDDAISDKKIVEVISSFADGWNPNQSRTSDPRARVAKAALKTQDKQGVSIEEQIAILQALKDKIDEAS
jgi:hypothetical protein